VRLIEEIWTGSSAADKLHAPLFLLSSWRIEVSLPFAAGCTTRGFCVFTPVAFQ